MIELDRNHWALILGGSSGFGLASARKLARQGMSIVIVHRDRRGAMPAITQSFREIEETGVGFVAFNLDALSVDGRAKVLDHVASELGAGRVRLLLHSIAFGNLKPLAPPRDLGAPAERARVRLAQALGMDPERLRDILREVFSQEGSEALAKLIDPPAQDSDSLLEEEDFARTIHAMGTSLVEWTSDLHRRGLFAPDARVLSLTSEGNEIAWRGYAAVGAAKAALESVSRAIAVELAPYGIRANVVQAGVTETPALRLIPGSKTLSASAKLRNPFGRLTTPEDVADVICLLCTNEARWINGALIRVDGGEHIAG
ncbi:MAG: SDR family oxidoreductase [Deltaproteobacteria bacterium]|nr:SDR family oxidoreductase [Deltaproteobacteria bacterium]